MKNTINLSDDEILFIIRERPSTISDISEERLTTELLWKIIKENYNYIQFLSKNIIIGYDVSLYVIRHNPLLIEFLNTSEITLDIYDVAISLNKKVLEIIDMRHYRDLKIKQILDETC